MKALPVESERGGGSAVDPGGGAGAGPPVAVGDVPHPLPCAGEGGEQCNNSVFFHLHFFHALAR